MAGEMCGDNRFELIAKAKEELIANTNIESSPEEMAVLDNILFRMWQMGWLPTNPWHKASERPEEKGMYLVWVLDYLHPITMCFGDYGWDNPTGEEITHWMPIPKIKEG